MKRVNINRDVQSRRNIASQTAPTSTKEVEQPIVEPVKQEKTDDAQSAEIQGGESDPKDDQSVPSPQKRGRKTQGNP